MAREFIVDGRTMPDPDPSLSVDEVKRLWTDFFPELSTADVNQRTEGETTIVEFVKRVGVKG